MLFLDTLGMCADLDSMSTLWFVVLSPRLGQKFKICFGTQIIRRINLNIYRCFKEALIDKALKMCGVTMNIIKHANHALKEYGGFKFLAYAVPISLITRYIQLSNRQILKKLIKQSKGRFTIKKINGSKMYLDINDEGLSHDLISDGVREFYATQKMKKEIKKGDVIVDIGANIGYYALLEARLVGKKGIVYAIEPVPRNIAILKKNIELNNYSNLEVYQLAYGGQKGSCLDICSPKI